MFGTLYSSYSENYSIAACKFSERNLFTESRKKVTTSTMCVDSLRISSSCMIILHDIESLEKSRGSKIMSANKNVGKIKFILRLP